MAKERKLQLQILDPTGEVVVTHHFNYHAGPHNTLRLTISDQEYVLDNEGIIKEFVKKTCEPKTNGLYYGEPKYTNRETGKPQKLFDILVPVYTVRYVNPLVGDKGEALYITLEANSEEQAKELAMQNDEFTKNIFMKYYDEKYLSAYKASGNYVIGKIEYFSGDPRL